MGNSQQGPKKEQEGRLPLFDFVTTMNVTTMDVPTLNVLLLHHKGLLDQILQYSMVVFLEDSERLNLAATCKPMRRIVEGYCRSAIDKILEEHRVDDSFEQRLLPKSFASGNFPFLSSGHIPFATACMPPNERISTNWTCPQWRENVSQLRWPYPRMAMSSPWHLILVALLRRSTSGIFRPKRVFERTFPPGMYIL